MLLYLSVLCLLLFSLCRLLGKISKMHEPLLLRKNETKLFWLWGFLVRLWLYLQPQIKPLNFERGLYYVWEGSRTLQICFKTIFLIWKWQMIQDRILVLQIKICSSASLIWWSVLWLISWKAGAMKDIGGKKKLEFIYLLFILKYIIIFNDNDCLNCFLVKKNPNLNKIV